MGNLEASWGKPINLWTAGSHTDSTTLRPDRAEEKQVSAMSLIQLNDDSLIAWFPLSPSAILLNPYSIILVVRVSSSLLSQYTLANAHISLSYIES